ncbi:hypothetical protein HAX54_038411, partial [Datura stramonium]|nr:hypothetical protein [Datura stramonium]
LKWEIQFWWLKPPLSESFPYHCRGLLLLSQALSHRDTVVVAPVNALGQGMLRPAIALGDGRLTPDMQCVARPLSVGDPFLVVETSLPRCAPITTSSAARTLHSVGEALHAQRAGTRLAAPLPSRGKKGACLS